MSRPAAHDDSVAADDVERWLAQAEHAIAPIEPWRGGAPPEVRPFELVEFTNTAPNADDAASDSRCGVELDLAIEFGRARMDLQDVLELRQGSIVALDEPAADPVDIIVNGRLIARGEVLVLNDCFCVRVAELVAASPSSERDAKTA